MPQFLSTLPTLPHYSGMFLFPFILLTIWTVVWKAVALWKAARLGQKVWFVVLLVVSTLGILDIIYIYAIARKKEKAPAKLE